MRGAIEPAIAELRRLDDKRRLAILLGRLARRELAAGNLSEARLHAEEAWRLAQRMQRPSEAAVAAALLMRVASAESDAASYADAEERLTELEATQTLSAEARAQIELATATDPTTRGDEPWSS